MNHIQKLQEKVKRYEEMVQDLRRHLALPKFNWPNDYIQTGDVLNILQYHDSVINSVE